FALSSATELPIVAAITEIGLHFDHHADENRDRLERQFCYRPLFRGHRRDALAGLVETACARTSPVLAATEDLCLAHRSNCEARVDVAAHQSFSQKTGCRLGASTSPGEGSNSSKPRSLARLRSDLSSRLRLS